MLETKARSIWCEPSGKRAPAGACALGGARRRQRPRRLRSTGEVARRRCSILGPKPHSEIRAIWPPLTCWRAQLERRHANVVLEALASGRRVVATHVGDPGHRTSETLGRWFRPEPTGLAGALERVLAAKGTPRSSRAACRMVTGSKAPAPCTKACSPHSRLAPAMPPDAMADASDQALSLSSVARKSARALAGRVMPTSLLVMNGPDSAPKSQTRPSGNRRVALTFDDGPDELTPEYLATLKQLDVRATFLLVGDNCARYPGHVRALADAGHELAGTAIRTNAVGHGGAELRASSHAAGAVATFEAGTTVGPPAARSLSLTGCSRCCAGFTVALWSTTRGMVPDRRT